jgi:hypothetical protein
MRRWFSSDEEPARHFRKARKRKDWGIEYKYKDKIFEEKLKDGWFLSWRKDRTNRWVVLKWYAAEKDRDRALEDYRRKAGEYIKLGDTKNYGYWSMFNFRKVDPKETRK